MDRRGAADLFIEAARAMWQNADFALKVVELVEEEPADGVLASLAYAGRPMAIGNSILRRPPRYVLRISQRLLDMADDAIRKIMVHEAAHLGHAAHDADFRSMVRAHGGSVSESAIEADVIRVEVKVGARYRVLREFPGEQEMEAFRWAKEQSKANPGTRYRIQQ